MIVHDMYRNLVIYSDVHHQVTRYADMAASRRHVPEFSFLVLMYTVVPRGCGHHTSAIRGQAHTNATLASRHRCHTCNTREAGR